MAALLATTVERRRPGPGLNRSPSLECDGHAPCCSPEREATCLLACRDPALRGPRVDPEINCYRSLIDVHAPVRMSVDTDGPLTRGGLLLVAVGLLVMPSII